MGPTCEVLLQSCSEALLIEIDAVLASNADQIERTRKGRVWRLWILSRPVDVHVDASEASIVLSAGCNSPMDYAILRKLAGQLAKVSGGMATEPTK